MHLRACLYTCTYIRLFGFAFFFQINILDEETRGLVEKYEASEDKRDVYET